MYKFKKEKEKNEEWTAREYELRQGIPVATPNCLISIFSADIYFYLIFSSLLSTYNDIMIKLFCILYPGFFWTCSCQPIRTRLPLTGGWLERIRTGHMIRLFTDALINYSSNCEQKFCFLKYWLASQKWQKFLRFYKTNKQNKKNKKQAACNIYLNACVCSCRLSITLVYLVNSSNSSNKSCYSKCKEHWFRLVSISFYLQRIFVSL